MSERWDETRADALSLALIERRWDDARGYAREMTTIASARDAGPYRGAPRTDAPPERRVLTFIDACARNAWQEAYFTLTDGGLLDPAMDPPSDLEILCLQSLGVHALAGGEAVIAAMAVGGELASAVCLELRIPVSALPEALSGVALEHYRDRVAEQPNDGLAWHYIAQHELRIGNENAAVTAAERAVKHAPHLLSAHLVMADVAESQNDAQAALRHLERASEACSDSFLLWSRLGEMKETMFGDSSEALRAYERALELDDSDVVAHEGKRRVLDALGADDALSEHIGRMLDRGMGDQRELRAALIAARRRRGDEEGAEAEKARFDREDEERERAARDNLEEGLRRAGDDPGVADWVTTAVLVGLLVAAFLFSL